jgi:hypothetical protein
MDNKIDQCIKIANKIEDDIASLHYELEYEQIVNIAIIVVKAVIKEIPMYTGLLNPKWEKYDYVLTLLKNRLS